MRDKKIEVDATLREIPAYTLGEFPIFRWEHRLDDFQTGELNRHWHPTPLMPLWKRGTGCLSTPGCSTAAGSSQGAPGCSPLG